MPISQRIKDFFSGVGQTATSTFKMYKAYKKVEKISYAKVLYYADGILYGLTEVDQLRAIINRDKDYGKIKGLDRIVLGIKIVSDVKGNPIILVSDKYHSCLDPNELRSVRTITLKGKRLKEEEALDALDLEHLKALNVEDLMVGLDLEAFDDERSKDISDKIDRVVSNNWFRVLDDIPNRQAIMLLVIGYLAGGLSIGTLFFVLFLGIEIFKYVH